MRMSMKRSKEERAAIKERKKYDDKIWDYCRDFFNANPGASLVDIGAYRGEFEKKCAGTTAKIVMVEPNPENATILRQDFPGATILEAAVGKETNPGVDIYQSVKYSGKDASIYRESAGKNNLKLCSVYVVTQITMECVYSVIASTVDLLFINCEGGEYDIFSGDLSFLDRTKMVYIHLHTKCDLFCGDYFYGKRKAIVRTLEEKGFKMILGMTNLKSKAHVVQLWKK
jgi:FkbM family methyltransferase